MNRVFIALGTAVLVVLVGCVIRTEHRIEAHVTLDIRHIEQQAEAALDYMEGKTDVIPELTPAPAAASTSQLRRVMNAFSPMHVAYAAEELNTSSARYRQILQQINARSAQINDLKTQGCVGENNRGYLELQDCEAAKDAARKNEVQKLMSEENADRKAFYSEIARLNSDDKKVTVSYVERIYAWKRLERAQTGEIFQLPPDGGDAPEGHTFEAFKASPLGQRLADKCVAGAWVKIP